MKKALLLPGWGCSGTTKLPILWRFGLNVYLPNLSNWSFRRAVRAAQEAFDLIRPDLVVGVSRGGALALNMATGTTPLILLAPAWRMWGKATSTDSPCVIVHAEADRIISYRDSVRLAAASLHAILISVKNDGHRLNGSRGREALFQALSKFIPRPYAVSLYIRIMLHDMTYQQAIKAPTGKGGRGWKYADAASMQAAYAQALGVQYCLTPEAIWDWANRHDVSLWQHRKRLTSVADLLLVAVLNNWSLDHAEKQLKGA
jgi:pimeloyl-ACP methyl ester carboxylesterase